MELDCLFTELSTGRGKRRGMAEQEQSKSCKAGKRRSGESEVHASKTRPEREGAVHTRASLTYRDQKWTLE